MRELERIAWAHIRGGFCRRCATLADALGHVGLPLTKRERELVQRLGRGQTTKEAAFEMGIAPKTAYVYRYRAMEKLGVHTFYDLLKAAMQKGIIPSW